MARNIPSQPSGGSLDVGATRGCTGLVLAAAVALGCAGAPVAPEPEGPPPFQGLARLVLIRWADRDDAARPKDPLDAVAESLAAVGRAGRAVDLGRTARGERALATLYREVEARLGGGLPRDRDPDGRPPVERLGRRAREAVAAEGADGAVLYLRLAGRLPVLPPVPGTFGRDPALDGPAPPAAALALVDRDGNLVWFGWGGGEPSPGAPVTAAEAVDALLRVIDGTPLPDVFDG